MEKSMEGVFIPIMLTGGSEEKICILTLQRLGTKERRIIKYACIDDVPTEIFHATGRTRIVVKDGNISFA